MLISLPSFLRVSKHRNNQVVDPLTPTHETMLQEHERRKGEELHRRLAHEKRFVARHNHYG
ncbi:hypothetical protein [Parasedimentitalea marina]|uniref:hypothetical protein n=1 Tax=Parasedimentitalea marina TaxID=2483033 RepID=UPI000FDC002F|nr:hypothetical protein [Parasedimentitalea marina]